MFGSSRTGQAFAWPVLLATCLLTMGSALAESLPAVFPRPSLDRWMYPFGFEGWSRPVAPTFASFDPRFDTRDAEVLLGWDTDSLVRTNLGPRNYVIRRARVTATVAPLNTQNSNPTFLYDPTYDPIATYQTNSPSYTPDVDPGRPVELFGAGFRGGYSALTFPEDGPYGSVGAWTSNNISIGTRNAFAAQFNTNGVLEDIANHVGQTNPAWTNAPFEVKAWATGTTTNVPPGEWVPEGSVFTFDLDVADPLVGGYFMQALDQGRLRLILTALSPAAQLTQGGIFPGGGGSYPSWYMKENILTTLDPSNPSYRAPAGLELEVLVIRPDDTDSDGLPDDWELEYLKGLAEGATDDPDGDGATHWMEYLAGTDPRDPSSVLKVTKEGPAGGPVVLSFPIVAGRSYRVERSTDTANWAPAPGLLTFPTRGLARWREEDPSVPPAEPTARFYRVAVE